ncbi:hypothetical protein GCM10009836_08790 [Pseudonocardia ailaonensis]|uniref:Transposase n=1 Tax=Pseudonocardia ailaonensis TaxID=367279 RepID=A0ABN2MNN2_9PSEU
MDRLDEAADELYGLAPDDFVPARDELVAAAKEAGDKDAARAIGRLRRPTQAAWLANLLARERFEQLDGLLELGGELSAAQRNLDGPQLRALSAQRSKLVGAMAREARRLAAADGHRVTESVEKDLRGILDAALADGGIAEEVRSGRLTRTVSWSGFGPADGEAFTPRSGGAGTRRPPPRRPRPETDGRTAESDDHSAGDRDEAAQESAAEREREARERERARAGAAEAVESARAEAGRTADAHEDTQAALRDAESDRDDAGERVDELTAELERAREARARAVETMKEAAKAEREAGRIARDAATALDRAEAALAELG